MTSPTYNREEIKANPVWDLAFTLSEIQNDIAPIGWAKYISTAECLLQKFEIKRKSNKPAKHPPHVQAVEGDW